ncbi:MAG TPA: DNA polymerase IV [Candidatus Brocadiia bacterium]|nr:DNA polymerase IV [Candidatus Brocadiia bacterium]
MRGILHVDMDAFYASVEQLDHPEWRGRPVIVGGLGPRSVVSAASYEARRFGVHSAMPMTRARRLCPHAVFTGCSFGRYEEMSGHIREIFLSYTPLVEPLSLDEAFLDVTGSLKLFGPAPEIGRLIKQRIKSETGLTASVGVAPNKFLAKLASDLRKPDGFVVITEENKLDVLRGLPVSRLWGVGETTCAALDRMGIRKIGDLWGFPLDVLEKRLGSHAESLLRLASGEDDSPVIPDAAAKSMGAEVTFPTDLTDPKDVLDCLLELTEEVAGRLVRSGFRGKTVTLKIRFPDFTTLTRSATLPEPTNLTDEIWPRLKRLYEERLPKRVPVRLAGIQVSNLSSGPRQLSLFDPETDKRRGKLAEITEDIRRKYGKDAIRRGRLIKGRHGEETERDEGGGQS